MPLFNRSDLGRLYISRRGASFLLVGDGAVDGLVSATTVSMAGRGTLVGNKTWTGTATARPGHALVAAAASPAPIDMLVLYGRQCDVVQQTDYTDAVLVEGVVFSADTYTALTALTSGARNVVSSTHSFAAERVLRVPAPAVLYRLKTFDGTVAAITYAGERIYVLVAKSLGGGTWSLTLAWSDALQAGNWYSAAISGSYVDPATLSPAGSWSQAAIAVLGDDIYISTVADILRLQVPPAGVTTLYAQPVRPVAYSPSGSPDQRCRMVGLYREGDLLYAGSLLGQIWRIAASDTVLAWSIGGTTNRAFTALDDGELVLVDTATVRSVAAGGRQRTYSGWTGTAMYAWGVADALTVATTAGKIWQQTGATWTEGWSFGGNLLTLRRASHNLIYAIAVSGASNQVWMTINGGASWTAAGDPLSAVALCPLPDGKCLVGGANHLSATAPPEQLIVS